MEAKKISFGFSKVSRKTPLLPVKENANQVPKVDLISCLEGHAIKLVEEKPEEKPLIIPLKDSQKTSGALVSLMKRRAVLLGEDEPEEYSDNLVERSVPKDNEGPEDIEKRAARELLAEIQKNDLTDNGNNLVLPVVKPEDLPLEGAKESNLDDYESVPIQDFGKAMLRGMGWADPLPKTNRKGGAPIDDTPTVRPKGMGLGADKALKKKSPLVAPEANEVLEIKRNAYVVILGGKYKDLYGKIEGFDDHAGRVIVKMAIGGAIETFNEFLCQPVSRKQYAQYGKCINSSKYEEYKRKENEYGQIKLDKNEKDPIRSKSEKNIKSERHEPVDLKHQKNECDFAKEYNYAEDKKRENNSYREDKERNHKRTYDKYDGKTYSNYEEGDDMKNYSRQYDDKGKSEYYGDDDKNRRQEHDNYDSRSTYSQSETVRRRNNDDYKTHSKREYERSSKSSKHDAKQKRADPDLSSSPENSSHIYKHKSKSKKSSSHKKSKKSKKIYKHNLSDSETSSTDPSSDSEEEKYKKHKKKTKKSKRQRDRSRSRGRR